MANIKSAKKRIKTTAAKTQVNKAKKTEIKSTIIKFNNAIEEGNIDEAKELFISAEKQLARAAVKNIIHDNAASRKISQLSRKLNKAS